MELRARKAPSRRVGASDDPSSSTAWTSAQSLRVRSSAGLRIATPAARFGVPVARTLGNCLSALSLARIGAAVGVPIAKRMVLLGEIIPADELLGSGFLLRIVEREALGGAVSPRPELAESQAHADRDQPGPDGADADQHGQHDQGGAGPQDDDDAEQHGQATEGELQGHVCSLAVAQGDVRSFVAMWNQEKAKSTKARS